MQTGCRQGLLWDLKHPILDTQPQHRVPVQQGSQHHLDIGLARAGRCLYHHRLVELIDRGAGALDITQPPHDRRRRHRPHALVDRPRVLIDHTDDLSQPGHRLLHEDVTRPAHHAACTRPRNHLHGQNAVSAKVEEGVVDPNAIKPEYLRVNAGQCLLDRIGRGAVSLGILIFGSR
ncbi:Uncharacterised protein [Mycobacteroides abscessus subsp. abscessus]|nr:Uncharacterised protein [Mycobacteroides abscessus subsp. abscessus]